jgi:ABC-2 type transport system permease protein
MKSAFPELEIHSAPPRLGSSFDLGALWSLFILTLRQDLRGRRLLVLSLLFLLPSVLVLVIRLTSEGVEPEHLEFGIIFNLIPHTLATLTALLYAAGMIQDEVEEQTLTYLLLRPLPRWALYITRFVATWLVTTTLTIVFTYLTFAVIWWDSPHLWTDVLADRAWKTAALLGLSQAAYCAGFGALSVFFRWAVVAGLCYIFAIEGLLASFPTVLRTLTVMFYFRVLVVRWLAPPDGKEWGFDLDVVPGANQCLLTVLIATLVLVLLGALKMQLKEFRMKTPEGS